MPVTELLTYRLYREQDRDDIIRLWEEHSGWGTLTHEEFDSWFMTTPYGPCLIVVAHNEDNEMIGQLVFYPTIVVVDGQDKKAFRGAAPVLNNSIRKNMLNHPDHPVFGLIKCGFHEAALMGYELIYSFPSAGWTPLLRLFPSCGLPHIQIDLPQCFAISLEGNLVAPGNNITLSVLDSSFGKEYDELWSDAQMHLPILCGIKRSAGWLAWKIATHLVLEAREKESQQLIGYISINKNSGLIVDMLARTMEDLEQLLRSTVFELHQKNERRIPLAITKLKGIVTNYTTKALKNIPYEMDAHRFGFFSYGLQKNADLQKIAPSRWYMMPND